MFGGVWVFVRNLHRNEYLLGFSCTI